jgi:hypothetical protein
MEKRIETDDGRVIRVRVDDDTVASDADRPAIESDPDELDEGATTAMVLVDSQPNTMTVEGAIVAIGRTARSMAGGGAQSMQPGNWWHDWGKYLIGMVALLALVAVLSTGILTR